MSTPYRVAARDYLEAGWSPIPLPGRAKDPVPDGYTGAAGKYVGAEEVKRWAAPKGRANAGKLNYPCGNIAIRLPPNVLGIDVDAYGEKRGAETLAAAEEEWGALPPTYVSTSRTDGVSGIRLYRIPEGLAWPGQLPQGRGVELLRWDHRYAVVAPSEHPEVDARYEWYRETEEVAPLDGDAAEIRLELVKLEGEIPSVEQLPELPPSWVEGLTNGVAWKERAVDETLDARALQEWLAARPEPDEPCAEMLSTISKYSKGIRKASDDGGAHDAARDAAWAILGDAAAGHTGVVRALTKVRAVFLNAVKNRRADEGAARSEWARIVARGAAKIAAEEEAPENEDPCTSIGSMKPVRVVGRDGEGTDSFSSRDVIYGWDQFSNAQRLLRVMAGRGRYIAGIDRWYVWDGSRWTPDNDGQVERWMTKAINQIELEAGYQTKEEDIKRFKAWQKTSSKVAEVTGAIRHARGRKGITVPLEHFDTRPNCVGLPNGELELTPEGARRFAAFNPEHFLTQRTAAEWKEDARSAVWEEFLERALPDEEVRAWVQKLVGYSLYGTNFARLFIVCYGPTSTGKSTFTEALANALGDYASSVNLSLFRDNQDERPRADLVRAMGKRLIIAEEASASWHLHPDQVKRLTGNSRITARLPHKGEYLERVPAFTPWLVTNTAPSIEGADAALWRRIRVVPFTEVIQEADEDATYGRRLATPEALSGILMWAIEGWNSYCADPDTSQPAASWGQFEEFKSDVSDFDRFVSEACAVGPNLRTTTRVLYEAYMEWATERNGRIESETLFGKFLNGRGFDRKSAKSEEGKVVKIRVGIALLREWRSRARG